MGTNSVYLIPRETKMSAEDWAAKARRVLLEMEVISFWEGDRPHGRGA